VTGPELKAAIRDLGLSQVEFAARLRMHYTTVYDWTRGERDVPPWVDYMIDLMREQKKSETIAAPSD
jgi:DNA-binding transcriptional regulator YiaG